MRSRTTDRTRPDKLFNIVKAPWSSPQRRLRSIIAVGALITGAATLSFSSGVGMTFLLFGAFTAVHLVFDITVARADAKRPQKDQQSSSTGFAQFVDSSQAAVITAAATILGLITAFSGGALPAAAKVAVVGLGGGVLVLFVSRGSQARLASAPAARVLGTCADIIGFALFTLGLIAIIVSLFITGGLGKQGTAHNRTSLRSSHPTGLSYNYILKKMTESIYK